ncbi:MAG TPA: hypothetical protein PKI34_09730 [Bacteroidales bacterium]|nr:hypothetical protein [Bacteroidales bacterium]
MISRQYKRLIRKQFKGDLSKKELEALEKGREEIAEVKAYIGSLSRVDELLTDTARENHAIDVKDAVMQSIRQLDKEIQADHYLKKSSQEMNPWTKTIRQFFPNPQWNLAFSFIAGILITSLLFGLFYDRESSGSISEQDITGTMGNKLSAASLTLPVELPDVKLNLQAYAMPQDFTQMTIEVESENPCMINISYNNTAFQVWSLRAMQDKPGCEIMAAYKAIRIGNSGKNTYSLLLKKLTYVSEELILDLYVAGNLEYSTHFEL